jgi:hypothetical protein
MKREPTTKEHEKIAEAIFADDRIEATNLYISITECGLTDAQAFVREFTAELRALHPDRFSRKQQRRRLFRF